MENLPKFKTTTILLKLTEVDDVMHWIHNELNKYPSLQLSFIIDGSITVVIVNKMDKYIGDAPSPKNYITGDKNINFEQFNKDLDIYYTNSVFDRYQYCVHIQSHCGKPEGYNLGSEIDETKFKELILMCDGINVYDSNPDLFIKDKMVEIRNRIIEDQIDWSAVIEKIYPKISIRYTDHEFRTDTRDIEKIDGIDKMYPISVESLTCNNSVKENPEWDSEFKMCRNRMIELYNQM